MRRNKKKQLQLPVTEIDFLQRGPKHRTFAFFVAYFTFRSRDTGNSPRCCFSPRTW